MPTDLGHDLLHIRVILQPDTDYLVLIRNPIGEDWPTTVTAELVFDGTIPTTFTGSAVGDAIVFNENEGAVNTLLSQKPEHAVLYYIDGTTRLGWAHGGVSVR